MKLLAILFGLLVALFIAVACVRWSLAGRRQAVNKTAPASVYMGLRERALHASRTALGLPVPSKQTEPWGAVMEWGVTSGTATIVAFSDGSASVYVSSGGSSIGGQAHESIRDAAKKMVAIAAKAQPQMSATTDFPLPHQGEVILYVLTDAGVFFARGSQDDFASHRHPLSDLGDAAQNIITQYRLIQENDAGKIGARKIIT